MSATFVGLATVDLSYFLDSKVQANTKYAAQSFTMSTGGPATNACITYRLLGGHPSLVTRLGQGCLAQVAKNDLIEVGIDVTDVSGTDFRVPISSIAISPNGDRTVLSAHSCSIQRTAEPSVDELDIFDGSGVVLLDGHMLDVVLCLQAQGTLGSRSVVLDGGSWKPGLEKVLPIVDYAICSGSFRYPGSPSLDQTVRALFADGVRHVAFTNGGGAVLWWTSSDNGKVAIRKIDAIDTLGAGDVFHGAFVWALEAGKSFQDALRFAGNLATMSCEYQGPRTWVNFFKRVSPNE